ncbi:MAG: PLP-dependent aminotransferase family protein [Candidatus Sulfotelmatobacter sp.]
MRCNGEFGSSWCSQNWTVIQTQGLEITTRVLLDSGDKVWMEEPGYRFARSVFACSGCVVVPIRVDDEGLNIAAGAKRCGGARAVLVTPSHQYPLGVTMSASRRLQLLHWAESNGSWIIEDDYDSEYRYEGMPVTSLQGLDRNSRVVYIGTFSKVLFPSLRLGYGWSLKIWLRGFLPSDLRWTLVRQHFLRLCWRILLVKAISRATSDECDRSMQNAGTRFLKISAIIWGRP